MLELQPGGFWFKDSDTMAWEPLTETFTHVEVARTELSDSHFGPLPPLRRSLFKGCDPCRLQAACRTLSRTIVEMLDLKSKIGLLSSELPKKEEASFGVHSFSQ